MILFLPPKLRKIIERHEPLVWFINLIVVLVIMFIVHVFVYKWVEGVNWEESLWVTWATFSTVGYGDFSAQSTFGRFTSILLGTVGIAVLGTLFAATFEVMQYRKNQRRFGFMSNPIKNGYVIFHFPGEKTLRMFLREIYAIEGDVGVCIVDESIDELPPVIAQEYGKQVHFIRGSSLDKETYEKANLAGNKTVIVFPKDPSSGDTDGNTNTVVKLVLSFVGESTRVLYLLVDPKNGWMFDKRAIPVMQDLEILAIVQECQDSGTALMVERLLHNTRGANPKSVKPKQIVGFTWQKFQKAMITKNIRANPLALIRNGEPESCPDFDTKIQENDTILIAAYDDCDWEEIERKLITTIDLSNQ